MNNSKTIVLVSGANRGIGFEVCRQLAQKNCFVLLGARDIQKGTIAAKTLVNEGLNVKKIPLDVTNIASITAAKNLVEDEYGLLDVLVNNAGGNYDYGITPSNSDLNFVKETLELNLLSVWQMIKSFLPLIQKSKQGRIVNVSSGAGSFSDRSSGLFTNSGSVAAYGVSKLALNGLTVKLAAELRSSNILINSVCPGFTATYAGAEAQGARPVKEGAASVVWGALIPNNGPTGGFFRDGKSIGW
jgi:NAD(P)-dependent dehydrogenase (short-subunit alcohol dehydrogenase family)